METTRSELCQLLIDCIKKDESGVDPCRLSSLSPESWQAFLALAKEQRVMPLLRHRLLQKGLDTAVPIKIAEQLREAYHWNTLQNLRHYGELHRLLTALKPEGIPLILLKGIYLADAVYSNMGLREMSDIDVLARPADLERIAKILTDMGYVPLKPICVDTILKSEKHLPPLTKPGHAGFEIHWTLTEPGVSYGTDPSILWERAIPVHIAGCDALALSPEDHLLYLCVHTSYQHQFTINMLPFCDIAETAFRLGTSLNWQELAERAEHCGWQRGVYLTMRLAKKLTGADVPADILERLRPADMMEALLEVAQTQLLTDKNIVFSLSAPFAELLGSRRLRTKLRIFWHEIFLPRARIAEYYSVPKNSVRIYACYPLRIVDVLRRHGHNLKKYEQNDAQINSLTRRINLIAQWLARPV